MLTPIKYGNQVLFSKRELACRHCGKGRLAPGFAEHLKELRLALGLAMHPTSVCRCAEHNKAERGHPRSLHVFDEPYHPTEGSCALDVRTYDKDEAYRERLITLARELGWSIGFARTFVHLDRRSDYTHLPRHEFYY